MNKQELVKAMATEANMTQVAAAKALEAFQNQVVAALQEGKDVMLVNFGTFKAARRSEREGRNPKTGEPLMIPAKTVPRFAAGKGLKDAVN